MTACGDYYSTLVEVRKELTQFKKDSKITIISNSEVRAQASRGNNNMIMDYRYLTGEIKHIIEESTESEHLIFDEGEYIETREWVKEWKINDKLPDIMIFENEKGIQLKTGVLTLT